MTSPKTIWICGPTASGKTAIAVELAQAIGGEIINADSGQVYCGLNIGTAKPTAKDRARVSFHLLDILVPSEVFSVAEFRRLALEAIAEIQNKGKVPIVCGGTGLYLKALEKGLFKGPKSEPGLRQVLEEEVKRGGVDAFHEALRQVDAVAAESIPRGNRQRLIRAMEVFRLTGRPISEFWREHQLERENQEPSLSFLKLGLDLPRDVLRERIDVRISDMMNQGFVEEVKGLKVYWDAPSLQIIGYKEIISHLRGEKTLSEATDLIKIHTRQYAKRQRTWFRKDLEIRWFDDPKKLLEFGLTNS
jgi:tRNA dimethylallyltransferase